VSRSFGFRGPDGDIDLDRALGSAMGHYVALMVSGTQGTCVQPLGAVGEESEHGPVMRQGFGRPVRASASGTVARQPEWVWDVCAYYLVLGVHWRATRGEIRRAYVAACARDDGQEQDEQLTYALAQLLDERVRRAYDMMPLGGVFTWDRDIEAAIKRAAAAEAGRRMAEGDQATARDVMEEMGFQSEPPAPEDDEDAGEQAAAVRAREAATTAARTRWSLQWGYYVLPGRYGAIHADEALLEAWQGMVAAALRERGISMAFAVGQGRTGSPSVLRNINEPCIFVVTKEGASPARAESAVEKGIALGIVEDESKGAL
jgi:hypothetical protein